MKISLRFFPTTSEGRRGSLITSEVTIHPPDRIHLVRVKDFFQQHPEYNPSKIRLARMTQFLQLDDILEEGDILNVLPV